MLRQDTKIKINQMTQQLFLTSMIALALTLFTGCTLIPETDPSRYQCRTEEENPLAWKCTKDDTRFSCVKTACVPEWCDLPLQSCGLEPLTGGTDSCGFPCNKPSTQWPNCNEDGL